MSIPHSVTFELRGVALCLRASQSAPLIPVRAYVLACALKIFSLVTPTQQTIDEATIVEPVHLVQWMFALTKTQNLIEAVVILQHLVDQGGDHAVDPIMARRITNFFETILGTIERGIAGTPSTCETTGAHAAARPAGEK